jgi:16S rRNA C967 or C1407 C5-methylase (RsmB/RsmF family)/NOL1/NOP2/fmu family ribosome biogenesis protein
MIKLPAEFVARISTQFLDDALPLLLSLDLPAESSVRINKSKRARLELDFSDPVEWCEEGFFLKSRPAYTLDPLFHAGCYYPQESSSMFLSFVLNQLFKTKENISCLDFCAAPGGKSLIISDFIGEGGLLVSNEINKTRNAILREVVTKWGCKNVVVTSSSAPSFSSLSGYFDCVLVDAPCSGEGMFRKDHEARNEWSSGSVQVCAQSQKEILSHLMDTVAPGGFLIYSTCTFSQDENKGSCMEVLGSGNFEAVELDINGLTGIRCISDNGFYGYQFLPHLVRGEGFFVSVFRRVTDSKRSSSKFQKVFTEPSRNEILRMKQFTETNGQVVKDKNEQLWLCPLSCEELNVLAGSVYITLPGVEVGRLIWEDLIPAHALALSGYRHVFVKTELDIDQTLGFLRGESISIPDKMGWLEVNYNEVSLGGVKCVGGRCNNYYPKEFRIRMKNPRQ